MPLYLLTKTSIIKEKQKFLEVIMPVYQIFTIFFHCIITYFHSLKSNIYE